MKQKYIILHHKNGLNRAAAFNRSATFEAAVASSTLQIETEELDYKQVASVASKSSISFMAPAMPMSLITPVDMNIPATAAGAASWGIDAVGASTSPYTGKGITVAVLDTGIDSLHPAFSGVTIVEKDFTQEGNGDRHGHGTHCAGTIFGRAVNGTRIGVATGISRALIGKVLGGQGGGSDIIANAIFWAVEEGANVISMSLGIDFPGYVQELVAIGWPVQRATSHALEGYRANVMLFERLASYIRVSHGVSTPVVTIAAAGNESARGGNPDYEIAVSPPAVSEGIISVAALQQGTRGHSVASFSNTGALISGPGVGIISAKAGGGLVGMSGTSMATPHVAGVAALWAEQLASNRMLTTNSLNARLIGSGSITKMAPGFDPTDIGTGMVTAPQI